MVVGYLGVNARAVISGKNLLPTRVVGSIFTGLVPHATKLAKIGHIDDVLIYVDYQLDKRVPQYYQVGHYKHCSLNRLSQFL